MTSKITKQSSGSDDLQSSSDIGNKNNPNKAPTRGSDIPTDDNNANISSKKSEQKLRPEAPEFDGISGYDPHSNIDPYGDPLGVSTRPEYVPPAEISPKPVRTNAVGTHLNLQQPLIPPHHLQAMYAMQQRTGRMAHVQMPPEGINPAHLAQGQATTGPLPQHLHPSHGMMNRGGQNRPVSGRANVNTNIAMSSHLRMPPSGGHPSEVGQTGMPTNRGEGMRLQGVPVVNTSNDNNANNGPSLNVSGQGYTPASTSGTLGQANNDGIKHGITNAPQGDYDSNHSQHDYEENQQPSPPQGTSYQRLPRSDTAHSGQMPQNPMSQQQSPNMYSKPPQITDAPPGYSFHSPIPMQSPYVAPVRSSQQDKTKQYQMYGGEDESALAARMQQAMKGNVNIQQQQYEYWKSQNRHPQQYQPIHGLSPMNTAVGIPSDSPLPLNAPGIPVGPNPTNMHTLSPTLTGGLTAMPQSGIKSVSRNFGVPKPEDIDSEFTNSPDLVRNQQWELLESAKRWLPGEGTVIQWKGFCYVIGAPIHMGMNGHIHFCYRYKLPEPENVESQSLTSNDITTTNHNQNESDIGRNERKQNTSDVLQNETNKQRNPSGNRPYKFTKKDVATVAAKIVPNTSAFAREIVILRDLQGCENITTLYDVLESKRTLISILELAKADVYHFFVGREASRHGWSLEKPAVREAFARMVVTNAVQGLKQMHDKGYLHCDLKSLNVLLYIYRNQKSRHQGVYMKAKLTDFGHSSKGKTRTAEATFRNGMARVGTAGHVAPELFKEGTACDYKIDIWSLGIVMFSMLVPGRLLFGEYTDLENLKKAYDALNKMNPWSNQQRPKWWTDFERLSPEARDLILWMTRFNADERPNADQIMKHPWFQISMGNLKPGQYRPKLKYVDMLCSSSIAQE